MYIVNAKISKKINRYQVLKEIYYRKPVSCADLAKKTGLTSASITKIINEFIKLGIVKEVGRTKTIQGRKPVLIDIVPDSFYIVGIYIARKSMSGIITNMNADIITRISHKGDYLGKVGLSEKIIDLINELFKGSKVNKSNILGIGISVPGPINSKSGEVTSDKPPYNWSGVSLKDNIFKEFNIPVFADNCSNVAALGSFFIF